jgi:nicotinamide-nucleotide amidase
MKIINASIITIGDELLIGQTIDTNSAWMAQELNKEGIWVSRRVAVGDNWDDIWQTLDEESKHAELILITGGLGPTADDITKPLLCKYFGGKLVMNEQVLSHVKNIFTRLNRPMLERNLRQAEVPDVCTVLHNERGTAPGMLFRKAGQIFISLPGVPHEMKGLMVKEVLPLLKEEFTLPAIIHKTIFTAGVGESFLAERIQDFENSLPSTIKLAYLPAYCMVRLRLTARGEEKIKTENELMPFFHQLKELVKDVMVSDEDEGLEITIGKILKTRGKTMGTAESCTGGYIAHLITSVAGSSGYYKGSIISYSNELKESLLHVPVEILQKRGAVSEETVRRMAEGAIRKLDVDYALAVSGIMGPDGGTAEKPAGTVWVAVGNNEKTEAEKFFFRFDRERNIELTAQAALNMLRKFVLANS